MATTTALISLSLAWTTLAAPVQWKATADLKNRLLKSIISQALIQQEDSSSARDREMASTFCKLIVPLMKKIDIFDEKVSVDDFCEDFELPPEPRPENKSLTRAEMYQIFLNLLKESGMDKVFWRLLGYS